MSRHDTSPLGNDLADLLDRERQAILAGDLDTLARLAPEKARLADLMAGTDAPPDGLERLQASARRNQVLLNAVSTGIRSVMKRVETLRETRQQLRTYDQGGKRSNLLAGKSTIERRA